MKLPIVYELKSLQKNRLLSRTQNSLWPTVRTVIKTLDKVIAAVQSRTSYLLSGETMPILLFTEELEFILLL